MTIKLQSKCLQPILKSSSQAYDKSADYGGGGFCGRHLVTYLQSQGIEVYTVGSLSANSPAAIGNHYEISDITNVAELVRVIKSVQPNYVFHLAGIASSPDPTLFYTVNTTYAAALLRAIEMSGLSCPIMLVGTSAEYGFITLEQVPIHEKTSVSPYHHYGISKLAQTHMGIAADRIGMPVVMVRPFNIIGCGMLPHLSVQSFVRQVASIVRGKQAPVIEVGNLGSSRDFIAVADVIPIYWQLIQNPAAYGEVINICSGQGVVMGDLLQKLIELSGIDVEVRSDPARFKSLDIPVHYGCTKKLEHLIGYSPTLDLNATLQQILEQLIADI